MGENIFAIQRFNIKKYKQFIKLNTKKVKNPIKNSPIELNSLQKKK